MFEHVFGGSIEWINLYIYKLSSFIRSLFPCLLDRFKQLTGQLTTLLYNESIYNYLHQYGWK